MRVIAGKCRSLPLESVPGRSTRPTTDRIKETLFNILQTRVPDASVLDLFAGSGALGIEALSRGAAFACFVDQDRKACEVIRHNLAFTKLENEADVLQKTAVDAVRFLSMQKKIFDLVFLDPPYESGAEREALRALRHSSCVVPDTLFVVEAAFGTAFPWLEEEGFFCMKEKTYKNNKHLFIKQIGANRT